MRTKNILFQSYKEISDFLNVPVSTAREVKELIRQHCNAAWYVRNNRHLFPITAKWFDDCHHKPHWSAVIISALCEVLEGFGTETLGERQFTFRYKYDCAYEYVNMGDTYTPTICFSVDDQKFFISDWGSIVENNKEFENQTDC